MKIRNASLDDVGPILQLDRELFPNPWNMRNTPNWHWKYNGENPAGKGLVKVMEINDKIATHFAVVPLEIDFFKDRIKASHSVAMMVAPEFQGKGTIKFVADKLFADCAKENIAFSYGYPNDLSYELHKKFLGYNDVTMMEEYQLKMDSYQPTVKSTDHKVSPVAQFSEQQDTFWSEAKSQFNIAVHRGASFLNWRYLSRPDQRYFVFQIESSGQTLGYSVLKMYQDNDHEVRGHFIDIMSLPNRPDILSSLLDHGISFFKKYGVNFVTSWLHGHHDCQEVFKKSGFLVSEHKRPFICRINLQDQKEKLQALHNGENWLFTMGDSTEIY